MVHFKEFRANRRSIVLAALAAAGMMVVPYPFFGHSAAAKRGVRVEIKDLHPFTHFAYIPANSNQKSIRLESIKAEKLMTRAKYTTDPAYCDAFQFREPGGSMFCPERRIESPAPSYQVTYSYTDQALALPKSGGTFTFQVFFHPAEVPPSLRTAIATGNVHREQAAAFFRLNLSRQKVSKIAIDQARSCFCKGYYLDGSWTHFDRSCRDRVVYKTAMVPSQYLTVRVDPVAPSMEMGADRQMK
jgi:hypothetical protein